MGTNGCSNVWHASVTDLYSVTVENLVELMVIREMFIYEVEESLTYTCGRPFAVRWVEPNNFSASLPLSFIRWWLVRQSMLVAAFY